MTEKLEKYVSCQNKYNKITNYNTVERATSQTNSMEIRSRLLIINDWYYKMTSKNIQKSLKKMLNFKMESNIQTSYQNCARIK